MEAVWKFVGARIAGVARVTATVPASLAAIDRITEMKRVDLIDEGKLYEISNSCPECRAGSWQSVLSPRVWSVRCRSHSWLCAVFAKHPNILRLARSEEHTSELQSHSFISYA